MPDANSIPRVPLYEGALAEARVQQLGLPRAQVLVDSLYRGAVGARATNSLHPKSYPGQRMWAETVAEARRQLRPYGWEDVYYLGAELIAERRRGVAILAVAGDSATGTTDKGLPQARYERGEVIRGLIQGSLDTLFGPTPRPEWEVWFLLHLLEGDTLLAELSRPTSVGAGGWISSWHERIILPGFTFGEVEAAQPAEQPGEIDVPVSRRAS